MIRGGIDTGGTFTDVAVQRDGELVVAKVPTTPEDPSQAGADGLAAALDGGGARVAILAHGTTIATNALLQDALPPTALVTTRGFGDVVDIGRQKRLGLYDLDPRKPRVTVARRLELPERIDAAGTIVEPLDEAALGPLGDALAEALEHDGLRAVAIGFLHGYRNPVHEQAVERRLAERFGDALVVCRSSAVLPEFREYERFCATALNAALTPLMAPYLRRLRERLDGVENLFITQSDGTLLQADEIAALPIRSVLSGPSSGVVGAAAVMQRLGERDYVTLDMGGTSTDICAVQDGEPLRRAEAEIGGFVVRTPALDIHTIGAGGGSIAALDAGGHLHVGPRSAGADPGPANYGRGGSEPTVTDAAVVLGHLPAERALAAGIALDRDAAAAAVHPLAERLDTTLEEAAAGILALEAAGIERAVRTLVAGRGIDIRESALCVFGGAGPLLASHVARALQARKVVIPPYPGLLCAIGLLVADLSRVFSETRKLALDADGWQAGREVLDDLRAAARDWHRGTGLGGDPVLAESVDMRYAGQNHEIAVALPDERPGDVAALREAFEARHRRLYRFTLDRPADFVTWRVTATLGLPGHEAAARDGGPPQAAATGRLYAQGAWTEAALVDRRALEPGERLRGPAVVSQLDATTVLLPGDEAALDEWGNLHLEVPQ